jgi:O-antigen/teichoic acid export membrane protein
MIFKKISAYGASKIIMGVENYIFILFCIYKMNSYEYSIFSNAFAISNIINLLFFGFIFASIPIIMAKNKENIIIENIKKIYFNISFIILSISIILSLFFEYNELFSLITIISMAGIFSSLSDSILAIMNARHFLLNYFLIAITRYTIIIILFAIVGELYAYTAVSAILAIIIGSSTALFFPAVRETLKGKIFALAEWKDLWGLMQLGFPALLAFASYQISMALSRAIVSDGSGLVDAAKIGAVNDVIVGPVSIFFAILTLAMGPELLQAGNDENREDFILRAKHYLGLQFVFSMLSIAVFANAGPQMANFILGVQLGSEVQEIFIHIGISVFCGYLINGIATVAIADNKLKYISIFSFITIGCIIAAAIFTRHDIHVFSRTFMTVWAIAVLCWYLLLLRFSNVTLPMNIVGITLITMLALQASFIFMNQYWPQAHIIIILCFAALVSGVILLSLNFLNFRDKAYAWMKLHIAMKG